jgi:vitamin B12 transporter
MFGKKRLKVFAALCAAAGAMLPVRAPAQEAAKIDPIVVTATRIPQAVSEQASDVSVVTRGDIELLSPVLAGDVLREVPGLDVQRSGGIGARENIKIRGGKSTHTLVLIDGFPVNSPSSGEFDIGSLAIDDFDRVEVVRGAQSALYGSNAISGVVNFIPRKGEEGRRYGAGFAAGSFFTLKGNGFAEGGWPKGSVRLGFSGFQSDGILANDDGSLTSFLGTGEAGIGSRNRVRVIAYSTDSQKGVPIDFGGRDVDHRFDREDLLLGARWETELSKALAIEVSGAMHREITSDTDPPDPGETTRSDFGVRTRKEQYRIQARYSPSPMTTTFLGAEYVQDHAVNRTDISDPFFAFSSAVDASTRNRSVFLQEELRLRKSFGMSLGVRLDRNSESGTEFNPKLAAFYVFEPFGVKVRAAYGRGFRVPTIVEKFDRDSGNDTLQPEKASSYEAGIDLASRGRKATFSATYFYQDMNGLIQIGPPTAGHPFGQLQNLNHAFSRGVEAEAGYRLLPEAALALSYTWSDTWDSENQRRILGIPSQRGAVSLLLSPAPRWEARLDWRIESSQLDFPPDGFEPKRRPGYAKVDVFTRYRWELRSVEFGEIAVFGKIQNILDRRYEERIGFPAAGFNFLLGAEARI